MATSLSLDDLVALNEEIRGLVRSGVPLETGLSTWGGDVGGGLGRMARQLSEASARGESLSDFLASQGNNIPPVYRAVVAAGQKSGRLGEALGSLTRAARRVGDVRSAIGIAVLYPLLVVLLAYVLSILMFSRFLPALVDIYEGSAPRWMVFIAGLEHWVDGPWIWLPPVLVIFAAVFWWLRTRRAMMIDLGAAARWLFLVPRAGRVVYNARRAAVTEIMALLVEHEVPLDEALRLASQCTADRRLIASAELVAVNVRQGGTGDEAAWSAVGLPPFAAWLRATRGMSGSFATLARHMADGYRRQVDRDSQWLREYLPMWLTLGAGLVVVLVYALLVFAPWTSLLELLTNNIDNSLRIRP